MVTTREQERHKHDVFSGDLKDRSIAWLYHMPWETWVQKGHPKVCWPKEWLLKDLSSSVQIFKFNFLTWGSQLSFLIATLKKQ